MASIAADIPLRSIESDTLSIHLTTPSSTSPLNPQSGRDGGRAGTSSRSARSQTNGLTSGVQNIRLTDQSDLPHLEELNRAIEEVARGSDSRPASLSPEVHRDDTPRQRRHSRRSVSRATPARHEVSDEPTPDDAFHSTKFQNAFQDARRLMSSLESVLSSSSLHAEPDSTIGKLHEDAQELAAFQYPATRTVGLVGDSGAGKSSLLNSLLDRKDLARSSNNGEACTCVPTEYHYHRVDGITITVTLFTEPQLVDQLTELLRAYRRFHIDGSELDDADRAYSEERASLAIATFQAMFRGLMNDEDFLVDQSEDEVLECLTEWATRGRPVEINTEQSGLSLQAGSDALMELSSEPAARDQPAKWPYIKSIQVFLDAHILSRGLILVDLPGLRDLNVARRDITERYLLDCDEIFVICPSGRAVTDQGVRDVFQLAEDADLANVAIVCTRSDDILASEALRDWQDDERGHRVRELMSIIRADEREESDIEQDLKDLEGDGDLTREDIVVQTDLYKEQNAVRLQKKAHEFELQEFIINTRNEHIREGLHAEYDSRVSEGSLSIFCVSNRIYWDMREKEPKVALPYLNLSGIIELRKRCIALVANSQRQIATRYMKDEIPALLAKIELWVQSGARSGSEERRARICRALDEAECQLARYVIHPPGADQPDMQQANGKGGITVGILVFTFVCHATDNSFLKASFSAFCRNYGSYSTEKAGSHNWNEEAMEGMVHDLEDPWERLRTSLEEQYDELDDLVEEKTDEACDQIATTEVDGDDAVLTTVRQGLNSQGNLLQSQIERSYKQFESDLRLLGIDTLSGIRTSLFGRAVEDSYRRSNAESGRGSDARRKSIITSGLTREDVFRDLTRTSRDSFRDHANTFQEAVQTAIRRYLQQAQRTFDMVRSENVARESERDPDFRLRVEDATRDGREVIGRICSEVLHEG